MFRTGARLDGMKQASPSANADRFNRQSNNYRQGTPASYHQAWHQLVPCFYGFAGTLEFTDGRMLRFVRISPLKCEFQTASGDPVVLFTRTPGAARQSYSVVIQPSAANISELPWILMLGR